MVRSRTENLRLETHPLALGPMPPFSFSFFFFASPCQCQGDTIALTREGREYIYRHVYIYIYIYMLCDVQFAWGVVRSCGFSLPQYTIVLIFNPYIYILYDEENCLAFSERLRSDLCLHRQTGSSIALDETKKKRLITWRNKNFHGHVYTQTF